MTGTPHEAEPVPHRRPMGPVFVVGMNGSGSTMLAESLGRHPGLYVFENESWVLPWFIENAGRYGDLQHDFAARRRLADSLGRARAFWQSNGKAPVRVPDAALREGGFAAVVSSVYQHFAAKSGKTRWGDKSPMYLQHVALLGRTFPDAQFVHIYRDGRDAAQSFHRRWGYHPLRTIYRWKKIVSRGQEQGALLGRERYLEVRYEELTNNPERGMRAVCEFLGLEFDPRVLESSMRFVQGEQNGAGRMIANSGKWEGYFTPAHVAAMEAIAGAKLAKLGYACSNSQGDSDPSALCRGMWSLRDRAVRTVWNFRQYGLRSVPIFTRAALDALRQSGTNRF